MPGAQFDRQIWPIVVAHRGASSTVPENTLPAFDRAVLDGADVVELDVRMTLDGVAVVMHDGDVSSRTDGTGWIHRMTLDEVRVLDASGGRGPRTPVPTLREALELLSGRAGVDIEIKNAPDEPSFDPGESAAEETVRLLGETGFVGPVLVSSFHWPTVERVRRRTMDVATGLLFTPLIPLDVALAHAVEADHAFVLPRFTQLADDAGAEYVARAHRAEVRVGTWTVDDLEEMDRLFAMGVDAVATNDPGAAVAVRDRFRRG
jgi:glycerophosphoryl diester phosphodiesterase